MPRSTATATATATATGPARHRVAALVAVLSDRPPVTDPDGPELGRPAPELGRAGAGAWTAVGVAPRGRLVVARAISERGMATAEYAVGLIAACAFAVVLYQVVRLPAVQALVLALATRALSFAG